MANDLNQCNFIGRLGRDPEMRTISGDRAVCNFSIACGWKGKSAEGTEWVRVVVWGKLAEICGQYLTKGSRVFISGRMQTREWEDKDGNKRYTTEIIANDLQMLDSKASLTQQDGPQEHEQQRASSDMPAGDFDDDIPF